MLCKLLGQQVIFRNHQFFFIRIRTQFDNLHTIQQWARNCIQCIGSGNKHDLRKIIGNLQIMIPIGLVLLGIQYFQQSRTGIAPIIGAHFIDLVQQEQWVAALCLGQRCDHPTGHRTDIGLPMTADIRFIPHATQRNPSHISIQRSCDGICHRSLTYTGRAYQTKDLRRHLGCKLTNRNGFQNALFHFFHSVVIPVKNALRCSNVDPLLGLLVPGKLQNRIQIVTDHGCFRRAKGLLSQPIQIPQDLFLRVLGKIQLKELPLIIGKLRLFVISQLFSDHLHLLTQIIIPLLLVDIRLGTLLNIQLQPLHFHFHSQESNGHFQTAHRIQLHQQTHLIRIIDTGILSDAICYKATAFCCKHPKLHRLCRKFSSIQIIGKQGIGLSAQCAAVDILTGSLLLHRSNTALQIRLRLQRLIDSGAVHTCHQNPERFTLRLQNLLNLRHCTDGIQCLPVGIIIRNVLLGNQKQSLISLHGRLERQNGLLATNFKMDRLLRKHCQSAQCQNRHRLHLNYLIHRNLLNLSCRKEGGSQLPPSY